MYRRPPEAAQAAHEWRRFVESDAALLAQTGLPGSVTETQARFADFLMHGFVDHHDDPTRSAVDQLSSGQYSALVKFVERYFASGYEFFTPIALRLTDQHGLRRRFDQGKRRRPSRCR